MTSLPRLLVCFRNTNFGTSEGTGSTATSSILEPTALLQLCLGAILLAVGHCRALGRFTVPTGATGFANAPWLGGLGLSSRSFKPSQFR